MHKLILWFFRNLNNIGQILSLVCSFLIMTTVLYWLETILNVKWNWLNFIKPTLDIILDFANKIFPFSIDAFGTVFDIKFITAIIVLLFLMIVLRLFVEWIFNLEYHYNNLHNIHKKAVEKSFNKALTNEIINEEKKITKYMILINTKLQKKFSHKELNIDISEQNHIMNKYIFKKTRMRYLEYNDGFLYYFDDFNKIDNVLDVMFKILDTQSLLDYSVCIQSGNDLTQLSRLADLQYYGKIIFCADTLLRYKCNKSHRYGTQNVGIFQKEFGTMEVYEFHKIL